MSLPTKAQYLATLQPAVPAQDDLQCRICRQDYNHTEEEVVQASPVCSLHPFHKGCLVPWVDLADQNNCPACRRQLYGVQHPEHDSEYYDMDDEDEYLVYGFEISEPDFQDTNDETGSWIWFHSTYGQVLDSLYPTIRGTELALDRWPADCLSVESHAVIARLCASLPQYLHLRDELVSLTDSQCGDFFMDWVRRALDSFEDHFSTDSQHLVFPEGGFSVLLIAARVAHSLLDRVSQCGLERQSDLEQWLKLFSLRSSSLSTSTSSDVYTSQYAVFLCHAPDVESLLTAQVHIAMLSVKHLSGLAVRSLLSVGLGRSFSVAHNDSSVSDSILWTTMQMVTEYPNV